MGGATSFPYPAPPSQINSLLNARRVDLSSRADLSRRAELSRRADLSRRSAQYCIPYRILLKKDLQNKPTNLITYLLNKLRTNNFVSLIIQLRNRHFFQTLVVLDSSEDILYRLFICFIKKELYY